jgi:hypothetical protein
MTKKVVGVFVVFFLCASTTPVVATAFATAASSVASAFTGVQKAQRRVHNLKAG